MSINNVKTVTPILKMNALANNFLLALACCFLVSCKKDSNPAYINNDLLIVETDAGVRGLSFTADRSVLGALIDVIRSAHKGSKITANEDELSPAGMALKSIYEASDGEAKFIEIGDSNSGDVMFYINEVQYTSGTKYSYNISALKNVDRNTFEKVYADIKQMIRSH